MSRNTEPRPSRPHPVRRVIAVVSALLGGVLGAILPAVPATAAVATHYLVDQDLNAVVGLRVVLEEVATGDIWDAQTDATGAISVTGVPDGDYVIHVDPDELDLSGHSFAAATTAAFNTGNPVDTTMIERLGVVSGTITNWDPSFVSAAVQLYVDDPVVGWIPAGPPVTTTTGAYAAPGVRDAGSYTLEVVLDPTTTAAHLDAFYGGTIEPSLGITAPVAWGDLSADVTLPPAALVTGHVTSQATGAPLPGIWVAAEATSAAWYTESLTAADGSYVLRVPDGETVHVYADDYDNDAYISMTFRDLLGSCACGAEDVVATLSTPVAGVDFAMYPVATTGVLLGYGILDESYDPATGVEAHIYREVPGGWAPLDVVAFDANAELVAAIAQPDLYRVRFRLGSVWLALDAGFTQRYVDPTVESVSAGTCFIDTGFLDPADNPGDELFRMVVLIDDETPVDACGAEPAIVVPGSGGSTGGSGGSTRPRPSSSGDVTTPTPTPTPTPTATPTPTPRPSSSATPAATESPEETPVSGVDLWWLLWVLLGVVVVAIVGGALWFARRG